jgi:hypothetical protein
MLIMGEAIYTGGAQGVYGELCISSDFSVNPKVL